MDELNSSEWFGAVIRYLWYLGRRRFSTLYTPDQIRVNALVGWLFKVFLVVAVVLWLFWRVSEV